jgi:hypothetical protein
MDLRMNVIVFTVCWSLGSKMILPTIFDLSYDQNLTHVNFYRIDIDENHLGLTQRLNIVCLVSFLRKYLILMNRQQYRLFNGIFMGIN